MGPYPEIRKRALEDHYALLEACRSGDHKRALAIQESHLGLTLEFAELDPLT